MRREAWRWAHSRAAVRCVWECVISNLAAFALTWLGVAWGQCPASLDTTDTEWEFGDTPATSVFTAMPMVLSTFYRGLLSAGPSLARFLTSVVPCTSDHVAMAVQEHGGETVAHVFAESAASCILGQIITTFVIDAVFDTILVWGVRCCCCCWCWRRGTHPSNTRSNTSPHADTDTVHADTKGRRASDGEAVLACAGGDEMTAFIRRVSCAAVRELRAALPPSTLCAPTDARSESELVAQSTASLSALPSKRRSDEHGTSQTREADTPKPVKSAPVALHGSTLSNTEPPVGSTRTQRTRGELVDSRTAGGVQDATLAMVVAQPVQHLPPPVNAAQSDERAVSDAPTRSLDPGAEEHHDPPEHPATKPLQAVVRVAHVLAKRFRRVYLAVIGCTVVVGAVFVAGVLFDSHGSHRGPEFDESRAACWCTLIGSYGAIL